MLRHFESGSFSNLCKNDSINFNIFLYLTDFTNEMTIEKYHELEKFSLVGYFCATAGEANGVIHHGSSQILSIELL